VTPASIVPESVQSVWGGASMHAVDGKITEWQIPARWASVLLARAHVE
jgi:hypothetical protein